MAFNKKSIPFDTKSNGKCRNSTRKPKANTIESIAFDTKSVAFDTKSNGNHTKTIKNQQHSLRNQKGNYKKSIRIQHAAQSTGSLPSLVRRLLTHSSAQAIGHSSAPGLTRCSAQSFQMAACPHALQEHLLNTTSAPQLMIVRQLACNALEQQRSLLPCSTRSAPQFLAPHLTHSSRQAPPHAICLHAHLTTLPHKILIHFSASSPHAFKRTSPRPQQRPCSAQSFRMEARPQVMKSRHPSIQSSQMVALSPHSQHKIFAPWPPSSRSSSHALQQTSPTSRNMYHTARKGCTAHKILTHFGASSAHAFKRTGPRPH